MSNPQKPWVTDPSLVAYIPQVSEDFAWASGRYAELDQQYHGEVIGVWRKQVIGHSTDLGELLDQAVRDGYPRHEIAVVYFPDFIEAPH